MGGVEGFIQRLQAAAAKRLMLAAVTVQAEAKRDYSVPNPRPHKTPAPQGQHPRARTYGGRDSVAVHPATLAEVVRTGRVRVGILAGGKHLTILGRKGWAGLPETYQRVRPKLSALTGGTP